MKERNNCPQFDDCVVRALLKTIEIPQVLRYCAGSFENCRYLPRDRRAPVNRRLEMSEL